MDDYEVIRASYNTSLIILVKGTTAKKGTSKTGNFSIVSHFDSKPKHK